MYMLLTIIAIFIFIGIGSAVYYINKRTTNETIRTIGIISVLAIISLIGLLTFGVMVATIFLT